MTRTTYLLAATAALALAACQPDGGANDPAATNAIDNAAGGGAPTTDALANEAGGPGECKATEGVSSGPFCGFTAVQNLFPPVKQPTLTVKGRYWLNRRTGNATLSETVPPGLNPTILHVDLKIGGSGGGGDWVDVAPGKFNATDGQYKTVTVTDPNGARIDVPVDAIH